jgi:hypothetical protein
VSTAVVIRRARRVVVERFSDLPATEGLPEGRGDDAREEGVFALSRLFLTGHAEFLDWTLVLAVNL